MLRAILGELNDDPSLPWHSYPCLLWPENKRFTPDGYGYVAIDGRNLGVHRVSWTIANGKIPDGLSILHRCDVKPCFRPIHLLAGTPADNSQDMCQKGRQMRGELNFGAKLTEAQVLHIRHMHAQGIKKARIAETFSVSRYTVYRIIDGTYWRHI